VGWQLGISTSDRVSDAHTVAVVTALLGRVYRQRVVAEETLLRRHLPGYRKYGRRTRRLIPFLR
jgi:protein-S-isoprenylcysteine O-methyltransferase Ste14